MVSDRIKSHKDLRVWQESIDLVTEIYRLTESYPKEEVYGLTSQMRRAAVSIPSNIAEGAGRNSSKEFVQFLHIALGSIAELETQLIISQKLGFVEKIDFLLEKIYFLKKLSNGLIFKLKDS